MSKDFCEYPEHCAHTYNANSIYAYNAYAYNFNRFQVFTRYRLTPRIWEAIP